MVVYLLKSVSKVFMSQQKNYRKQNKIWFKLERKYLSSRSIFEFHFFLEKFPWNWNCNIYIFRAKRRWRKAVTGDPNKRIRDYMKETPQVKMQDKFSFTLGVIVICLSEFLILRMPNLFQYFYFALMSVLIAWRYYDYSLIKSELFLMDFCYFVNLSVFLQTVFYPDDLAWFKANYVLTQGPICIAIVVWRNSLVFHR